MAWVEGHENKIMAYLQTALTMLSGLIITFILKSKGRLILEMIER